MMKFRKGVLNCLIATSVAEEGLDIPDCNMIIRFDLYDTLIQYIQSRGRARHKHSKYIHMMESGNLNHRKTVREVRLNEGILKTFCMQLPEDRKLTGNDFNMDHFLAKERTHRNYTVPKTGAKLTYKSSLGVLANFVDSLPRGPDINLHAEYVVTVQSKQFIGEVILPEESPIRGAVGRPASTKQVAKCSAAFETCLLLIKGKYLDDRLLPIYAKQLPVMRNALLAVDSKKREAYDMRTKPKLWAAGEVGEELFMSILKLDTPESLDRPSQPLALLTRSPIPGLPSFPLHFGEGRRSLIQCIGLCNSLKVSAKILAQINAFTLGIFEDIFSKVYESNTSTMPYFLAPLKDTTDLDLQGDPSDMLAWETLEEVYQHQLLCQTMKVNEFKTWQEAPDDFFKDKYIVDVYDGSRKFWCKGLAPQYKPLDPVPADCPSRKAIIQRKTHNIMDYSNSMWGPNRNKLSLDVDQRVFEAVLIPLRRNLLDEMEAQADETPKRCFLIMEILKISAVSFIPFCTTMTNCISYLTKSSPWPIYSQPSSIGSRRILLHLRHANCSSSRSVLISLWRH
jgi:endoribonuclease Dicer